ncbi:DUF58 domain-containing protein [Nocardioides yefusunii]|uniref:DUF58 domain-containing protein n=1 Tax=Nocardioides yefusunii TaxID=2500546 RepID=A0ABW1QXF5_9ACTN|nr:DUF58 domain-containing protein [Nocardioides yefusunii]
MREAFASLTQRGRILLTCGIAVCGAALYLGDQTLLRVGLLLTLLPLFSTLVMARAKYRIALERRTTPRVVAAGQPARVDLRIINEGLVPPGSIVVEEELGYALGSRPRFRLQRLARGVAQNQSYRVSTDVRGRHQLGPALLRVSDPLGLVAVTRGFRSTDSVVVLPLVVPLDGLPLTSPSRGTSGASRSSTHGDADDTTVRAYRRGDDVRRIHWRSSARAGDLVVRQEEEPHRPAVTLLLDVRAAAHRGTGVASSFEAAVRIASSVLSHLLTHGQDVVLLAGDRRSELRASDPGALGRALEELAILAPDTSGRSLPLPALSSPGTPRSVVAVLGSLDDADRAGLAGANTRGSRASALLVDVEAWNPNRANADVVPTGPLGWRATAVGPRSSLTQAWRSVVA